MSRSIAARVVDVWQLSLDVAPDVLARLRACLSADEISRAARFASPVDAARAIAAWGLQRGALAAALGCAPRDVPIERPAGGRPTLGEPWTSIAFSLSHSGDWALLAVSCYGAVGVDIERIARTGDAVRLAERFFTADEARALRALPEDEQRDAFARLWTKKEAVLKAAGGGVPARLRCVAVSCAPCGTAQLEGPSGGCSTWTVRDLPAPAGYAAALATPFPVIVRDATLSAR